MDGSKFYFSIFSVFVFFATDSHCWYSSNLQTFERLSFNELAADCLGHKYVEILNSVLMMAINDCQKNSTLRDEVTDNRIGEDDGDDEGMDLDDLNILTIITESIDGVGGRGSSGGNGEGSDDYDDDYEDDYDDDSDYEDDYDDYEDDRKGYGGDDYKDYDDYNYEDDDYSSYSNDYDDRNGGGGGGYPPRGKNINGQKNSGPDSGSGKGRRRDPGENRQNRPNEGRRANSGRNGNGGRRKTKDSKRERNGNKDSGMGRRKESTRRGGSDRNGGRNGNRFDKNDRNGGRNGNRFDENGRRNKERSRHSYGAQDYDDDSTDYEDYSDDDYSRSRNKREVFRPDLTSLSDLITREIAIEEKFKTYECVLVRRTQIRSEDKIKNLLADNFEIDKDSITDYAESFDKCKEYVDCLMEVYPFSNVFPRRIRRIIELNKCAQRQLRVNCIKNDFRGLLPNASKVNGTLTDVFEDLLLKLFEIVAFNGDMESFDLILL